MRQVHLRPLILFLFLVFSSHARGQQYYPITDTVGTQAVGCVDVSVTHQGFAIEYLCGIAPSFFEPWYWIYNNPVPSSFRYDFSSSVNKVNRIRCVVESVDSGDYFSVIINDTPY